MVDSEEKPPKSLSFIGEMISEDKIVSISSLEGKIIDNRYKVLEKIGEGGMGAVYKAEHLLINRVIALKVLHPNLTNNEESLKRFLHEARVASKLNHPNAVTIYDFGVENSMPYLAMEYISGRTLKQVIAAEGAQSLERVCAIFKQASGAIAAAHHLGIVHRDLKPENLMLTSKEDGAEWVYVLDFGIAKMLESPNDERATVMTRTGMFVGTPQYMSPESAENVLDARSDIYSLGIIVYEMLTGEVPFKAPSLLQLLIKHATEKPLPLAEFKPQLAIPAAVDAVVIKALEKDPNARYQSVKEMADDLEAAIYGQETRPKTATSSHLNPKQPLLPKQKRSRVLSGLTFVVGLSVLALIYFFLPPEQSIDPEPTNLTDLQPTPTMISEVQTAQTALSSEPVVSSLASEASSAEVAVLAAKLTVTSSPDSADVVIDGEIKGQTPLNLDNLPTGTYRLVVKKKQYLEEQFEVVLDPDKPLELNVKLLKSLSPNAARAEAERSYEAGEKLLEAKNYQEAIEFYEKAIRYRPDYLTARLSLGLSNLRLQRHKQAYQQFQAAYKIDPNYPPTHYNLASYYALTGDTEKAVSFLASAVKLYPECREWAKEDPDFSSLKDNQEFIRLILEPRRL